MHIYLEPGKEERCFYSLDSLKRAMHCARYCEPVRGCSLRLSAGFVSP